VRFERVIHRGEVALVLLRQRQLRATTAAIIATPHLCAFPAPRGKGAWNGADGRELPRDRRDLAK
jgi:hypothetical protein